jgi:hypothetical protein
MKILDMTFNDNSTSGLTEYPLHMDVTISIEYLMHIEAAILVPFPP